MNSYSVSREKNLAEIITDIKNEAVRFVQTRVQLLLSELRDDSAHLKAAVPLLIVGGLLLATAYVLFTLAIVGLIAILFWNTPYVWAASFGIATLLWIILGAIFGYMGYSRLRTRDLIPHKTIEVLKADKLWLQNEARHNV
ncbi:MAG: phage holin family protein [Acidobacteriales bacterium]|nr:phage holin family protein [Terriglobales bacterium]